MIKAFAGWRQTKATEKLLYHRAMMRVCVEKDDIDRAAVHFLWANSAAARVEIWSNVIFGTNKTEAQGMKSYVLSLDPETIKTLMLFNCAIEDDPMLPARVGLGGL